MKICKTLLSLLITCGVISSGVVMSASAADSNIYNDSTYSSESKEEDQETSPEQILRAGASPMVEPATQSENVSVPSLSNPFNVFDIYDAHQKYVKLHSGDKSMIYKKAEGIDVSYAQGKIDWQAVKDS